MLNHIVIMGRLTKDPELRTTQGGTSVASFTVACERDFGAQEKKDTDFIECVAWRQTGEFVSKYFRKGSIIIVTGRLQSRKWQDRDGNNRTSWEIQADHCYFGEKKQSVDVQVPQGTFDGFKDMPGRGDGNPFEANGAYKQAGFFEGDGELPF